MATAEEWSEMENRAVKGRLFAQLPAQPDFSSSVLKAKKESSLTSSLFTDIPHCKIRVASFKEYCTVTGSGVYERGRIRGSSRSVTTKRASCSQQITWAENLLMDPGSPPPVSNQSLRIFQINRRAFCEVGLY